MRLIHSSFVHASKIYATPKCTQAVKTNQKRKIVFFVQPNKKLLDKTGQQGHPKGRKKTNVTITRNYRVGEKLI